MESNGPLAGDALEEALRQDENVPREHRLGTREAKADDWAGFLPPSLERCSAELDGGERCPMPAHELCAASCCPSSSPRCNGHSHRPRALLDILGYPIGHFGAREADVVDLIKKMWMGAGLVFENAGHFALAKRRAPK